MAIDKTIVLRRDTSANLWSPVVLADAVGSLHNDGAGNLTWSASGGGISGPVSSTITALVRWDDALGTAVRDSNVTLANAGTALAFSGAGGISAGGSNQNVTLTPSGTGKSVLAGPVQLSALTAGVLQSDASGNLSSNAPITTSALTQATAKLLGRATAGTGAIEEITLGTNLSFTGTTLNASGGGGGSPAGSNTQIQYNNSGAFGASSDLTWSGSSGGLILSGNSLAGGNPTFKITDSNANEPVWMRVEQTSVSAAFELGVAGASGQFLGDAPVGAGIFKGFLSSPGMALGGGNVSPLTSMYIKYGGAGAKGRVIIGGVTDDGTNDLQVRDNAFIKNSVLIGDGSAGGPFLKINSSTYTLLQYARGGASKFSTGTANATNDFITGTVQDDMAFKSDASKSILFSTDNGASAALKLTASNGVALFNNSLQTSNPSGGTAAPFKMGSVTAIVAPALALNYLQIDIAGTAYKIALLT